MSNAPIGVFDSGSGGLTIVRSLQMMLPAEQIIYVGDHINNPYGGKTRAFIRARVVSAIKFFLSKNCKLIVIACNTATIAGIDYYRRLFSTVPIVGVVPVIKTAAALTKTKHVIVLSTAYTAKSAYQKNLIRQWASDCKVTSIGSSKLVPLIEKGILGGDIIFHELHTLMNRTHQIPFDVVVLGCTHYPFIRKSIQAIIGHNIAIIDSSDAVARQVARILDARKERASGVGTAQFYTTGDAKVVTEVFGILLAKPVHVTHVTI